MITKLSATAPSWAPTTKLSASAPSWAPGGGKKSPTGEKPKQQEQQPAAKDEAASKDKAKKFSFSGMAAPFTPVVEPQEQPPVAESAKAAPAPVQENAHPVEGFPSNPGPGRPSKLVASAAPFTPKSANPAPSPATSLDPTAKEFRPEDIRTSPLMEPNGWRRTRSYEDDLDQIHSPAPGYPRHGSSTGFERRAMSYDSLDSQGRGRQGPVQPKLPKPPKISLSDEQLSSKHPLATSWTLWFKSPAPPSADWSGTLKTIFAIKDVETFWGVFNQIKSPSTLPKGSTYYLFREGIKPMWEDATCAKGGEWRVWVPPAKKADLDTVWVMITLLCIGEQLPLAEQVCGVAVETRSKSDRISLWIKTKEQQRAMALGKEFKTRLVGFVPADQPATFTSHSKALEGEDKSVEYCIAD